MNVIKNDLDYQNLIKEIKRKNVFLGHVKSNHRRHAANTSLLILFIKVIDTDETFVLNFGHQDSSNFTLKLPTQCINDIIKSSNHTFVIDKKSFIQLTSQMEVDDLLIYEFNSGITQPNLDDFQTDYEKIYRRDFYNNDKFNSIIPLSKHLESFESEIGHYRQYTERFRRDESYKNLNGIITETLAEVEKNGLHVDGDKFSQYFSDKSENPVNGFVYSEYNIFTSTGRPSNRYNGINYAALNKHNGCRSVFDSRFGKDGMLITMDYSAYHPHIIANLINFKLDLTTNIYDYLGRYYFGVDKCDEKQIAESKELSFVNLYGGVRDKYKNIPYFERTIEYINHRWEFFNKNGYIETPIFKRRITDHHISDTSPNKLFNYILQASETEFSIKNINTVNQFLKKKQSKVILYTYDSILIDACKDDGLETLKEINEIMVDNQFPVKCYAGCNYDETVLINI